MARLPTPSGTLRWLLTILVLGALIGVGLTRYNRLQAEQDLLLAAIAQSNKTVEALRATDLSDMEAEIGALDTRSASAAATEASLWRRFQVYTHSIEIQESLSRAATEAGVTITSLHCDGPTAQEDAGLNLESYTVRVSAESAVPPSLLNFLLKVSGHFESGSVSSVDMSLPPPPEEGSAPTAKSSLSFTLRVSYLLEEV